MKNMWGRTSPRIILFLFFPRKRFHNDTLKGDVIMARNSATPVTFELPDGDHVELITWDFVLDKLDTLMEPIFDKMYLSNAHLDAIATRLEELANDEED